MNVWLSVGVSEIKNILKYLIYLIYYKWDFR